NLASSEYNKRREECETALKIVSDELGSNTTDLVDVTEEQLRSLRSSFSEKVFNRALYVTQENKRVENTVETLKNNNQLEFGELLYQSHEGLKNLYEVSCKELDFLVEHSKQFDAVIGSRMMGGGFGGCTISLVHKDHVNDYIEKASKVYEEEFSI